AERRLDRIAAGHEGAALGLGVAAGAIGERREIAAALDLVKILPVMRCLIGTRRDIGGRCAAAEQHQREQSLCAAAQAAHACTSGPGCLMYWWTNAPAAQ